MTPPPDTVGVNYVVDTIGYSRVTVYRWIRAGYLPTPMQTHPVVWPKDELDQWLREHFELK